MGGFSLIDSLDVVVAINLRTAFVRIVAVDFTDVFTVIVITITRSLPYYASMLIGMPILTSVNGSRGTLP